MGLTSGTATAAVWSLYDIMLENWVTQGWMVRERGSDTLGGEEEEDTL